MYLDSLRTQYLEAFNHCYPQAAIEARWAGTPAMLHTKIRGDRQEPMTGDQLLQVIATFKQRGRPVDRLGRICYER